LAFLESLDAGSAETAGKDALEMTARNQSVHFY